MRKQRKQYTPEDKVAILRRHLLEKTPVSDLCEQFALQPTVFYRWQKEFFENGTAAFQPKSQIPNQAEKERIVQRLAVCRARKRASKIRRTARFIGPSKKTRMARRTGKGCAKG